MTADALHAGEGEFRQRAHDFDAAEFAYAHARSDHEREAARARAVAALASMRHQHAVNKSLRQPPCGQDDAAGYLGLFDAAEGPPVGSGVPDWWTPSGADDGDGS